MISVIGLIPSYISNDIIIFGAVLAICVYQIIYEIFTTIPVVMGQIVENSNEGIIILDSKKNFLYANKIAKQLHSELEGNSKDQY